LLLTQLADILAVSEGNQFWEEKLRSLAKKKSLGIKGMNKLVREMYGGMGSLNDIYILLPKRAFGGKGNELFEKLRSDLYDLTERTEH